MRENLFCKTNTSKCETIQGNWFIVPQIFLFFFKYLCRNQVCKNSLIFIPRLQRTLAGNFLQEVKIVSTFLISMKKFSEIKCKLQKLSIPVQKFLSQFYSKSLLLNYIFDLLVPFSQKQKH